MIKNTVNYWIVDKYKYISKNKIISNSFWGIGSNIIQNILLSIFFIVMARKYSVVDFSTYIVANTIYGFTLAFSSLGLGQWFVRKYIEVEQKKELIESFFKIQFYIGITFYILSQLLVNLIYEDNVIRYLSALIGINLVFDNIIYVIKFINIAEQKQKNTSIILTIEAVLKVGVASILYFTSLPIITIVLLLITLRTISLILFINTGEINIGSFKKIIAAKVDFSEIKTIILKNWSFIIIGSISVIYWKIGNILTSKMLSLENVAFYEISFKLFSISEIIPVIASTSILPVMVKYANTDIQKLNRLYRISFLIYSLYGILTYTAVINFADILIPLLFGDRYINIGGYCKEMFLTMLILPTALLQANYLIAKKKEIIDMRFNLISLVINIGISCVGLYFIKSMSVINYAIFISFLVFHILQDIYFVRNSITKLIHPFLFYSISIITIVIYSMLLVKFRSPYVFIVFWVSVFLISTSLYIIKKDALKRVLAYQ